MNKSKIEWCDMTFNPVTGCLHGCEYCYARRIANRFKPHGLELMNINDCRPIIPISFKNLGCYECDKPVQLTNFKGEKLRITPYPQGFKPIFHRYRLDEPQKVKKPQKIFVVSMGDLFGEWVPDEWIEEVFKACEAAPWHKYLFLTKNPKRYEKVIDIFPETHGGYDISGCMLGTTITCQKDIDRIPNDTKALLDFVSVEPLLSEINMNDIIYWCRMHYSYIPGECVMQPDHETIDKSLSWVIIGAQTGPGAIPPKREWVENIVSECRNAGIPVFMKNSLRKLMGDEFVQEWPEGLKGAGLK
jgi:protein gp37